MPKTLKQLPGDSATSLEGLLKLGVIYSLPPHTLLACARLA